MKGPFPPCDEPSTEVRQLPGPSTRMQNGFGMSMSAKHAQIFVTSQQYP